MLRLQRIQAAKEQQDQANKALQKKYGQAGAEGQLEEVYTVTTEDHQRIVAIKPQIK